METVIHYWRKSQNLITLNGKLVLTLMSLAVVYNIIKGRDLGGANAAAYATAIGAYTATRIKKA